MSDTPRTDACQDRTWKMLDASNGTKDYVAADFARQLERENAELRKDKERLLEELGNIARANPYEWRDFGDTTERLRQFYLWSQSRARAAMQEQEPPASC